MNLASLTQALEPQEEWSRGFKSFFRITVLSAGIISCLATAACFAIVIIADMPRTKKETYELLIFIKSIMLRLSPYIACWGIGELFFRFRKNQISGELRGALLSTAIVLGLALLLTLLSNPWMLAIELPMWRFVLLPLGFGLGWLATKFLRVLLGKPAGYPKTSK